MCDVMNCETVIDINIELCTLTILTILSVRVGIQKYISSNKQ